MIFSIGNHIQLILNGKKTQTRRSSDRYEVGKLYSIQPKRTAKGIPQGKIEITHKRRERWPFITTGDAEAEGGYTPQEFEELYEKINPNWHQRLAYTFRFVETKKWEA